MAGKKFGKSTINWTELARRVPEHQKALFVSFKSKSDGYLRRVQNLPEAIPPIDWDYYKTKLRGIPGLVEDFERQYGQVQVPYPPDNTTHKIDILEKEIKEDVEKFKGESNARIAEYQKQLKYLQSLVPYDQMTMEDYRDAFPEDALDSIDNPTFWPHTPEEQLGYEARMEAERLKQEEAEEEQKKAAEEEKAKAEAAKEKKKT